MTTRERPVPEAVSTKVKPIVVGVDGSAHNQSAVAWAVAEAERSRRSLIVVSASTEYIRPIPAFSAGFDAGSYEGFARTTVRKLTDRLHAEHPDMAVTSVVKPEDPSGLILDAADGAWLVVVGKRGLGAFARIIVGSTSIAVAGRANCPIVIVPDSWDQASSATKPVLVGIDIDEHDDATVAFAFKRAHELQVPVLALYVWQTHPAVVVTDEDRRVWGGAAETKLREILSPWMAEFPDVSVRFEQRQDQPAFGILERGDDAQLVVLGRHTASRRVAGFAFGSVTRAVLHYSKAPVAVVPETSAARKPRGG